MLFRTVGARLLEGLVLPSITLLATRYPLLATRYSLLATRYALLGASDNVVYHCDSYEVEPELSCAKTLYGEQYGSFFDRYVKGVSRS